MVVWLISWLVC